MRVLVCFFVNAIWITRVKAPRPSQYLQQRGLCGDLSAAGLVVATVYTAVNCWSKSIAGLVGLNGGEYTNRPTQGVLVYIRLLDRLSPADTVRGMDDKFTLREKYC